MFSRNNYHGKVLILQGYYSTNQVLKKYCYHNREYAFDFSKDDIKADEFVNKPVKLDRLVEKIKQYL